MGHIELRALYDEPVCCADHLVKLAAADDGWRAVINDFLGDVHSGKVTEDTIHTGYYTNLAKQLTGAVAKGLGGSSFGADDYRNDLKAQFDHNIYAFSAAKSLTVLREYNRLLVNDKGEPVSFAEFKRKVAGIDELYNVQYLETEYNTAVASAQMSAKWQGLAAFDMLEYRTVGDDRVRPEHAALDGLILRSDDPMWNHIYPPNAWNCRCTVVPAASGAKITDRDVAKAREKAAGIKPYFNYNVGKERIIFKDDHPYFKNIKNGKVRELDAEKNYGMPSVEHIYKTADLPEYTAMKDKASANTWWDKESGEKRGDLHFKAIDNLTVTLPNRFRNHVLEDNSNDRYRFMHLSKDILQQPDEIWSNKIRGEVQQVYIKYYDKYPIVVAVNTTNKVEGITMYEVQKDGKLNYTAIKNMRRGVLKYKK